ncbi:NAD(P)/FAD-dependent oxidoreductase [Phytohabitans sp. ZYX-F-186]|uniref:NAD(P)/FAD-dependent oxidoreductase n=1 Tax=Phytohabitans maris TaxID=3071409 RepID=A0ABU0ZLE1_9ACTN|nr:NAD(P)/FAD-dependent oxidoreductase [Phytohabitans sp. ZYX-F-186]MDQ7907872.1 NAD(P)/FAD-dependent oxidoreductase [Phytohabitans sp. ZYX-F-186]
MAGPQHYRIAVIGAGFSGLGAAIRLKQRGYDDFVVLDRGTEVGGTWRDNTYPGCACDVPSHLYSFSFDLNPEWSRSFSPQPEIWYYLRRCVDAYGLEPHLRMGHEVHGAAWDGGRWVVETSRGTYSADVLISASGGLCEPAQPKLPGLETFTGPVFHSARWRHDVDLTGRRVAVVGTGASAIQFVPAIAADVARLHLFQRTPPWVLPKADRPISRLERRAFRAVPGAQRLARTGIYWLREFYQGTAFLQPVMMRLGQRMARSHLRRQVPDPALREKLTPRYRMGCKRVLLSNDYYPALTRSNVEVVTEGIAEVRPDAVVTADGTARPIDAIIFGTGFHVNDAPIAQRIRGRDGRTLAEAWQGSPRAYLGTTVAGFPNLFLLLGPGTGTGHTSVVFMMECQLAYVLDALRHLDRGGDGAIEPTAAAQHAFISTMDKKMAGTVWQAGCRSWYQDSTGRVSAIWPGYTWSYRLRTRRFDPAHYEVVARA